MLAAEFKFKVCLDPKGVPYLVVYEANGELDGVLSYEEGRDCLYEVMSELYSANVLVSVTIDRILDVRTKIISFDCKLRETNFIQFVTNIADITDDIHELHKNLRDLMDLEDPLITEIAEELSSQLRKAYPEVGANHRRVINGCKMSSNETLDVIRSLSKAYDKLDGDCEGTTGVSEYFEQWNFELNNILRILDTEYSKFERHQRQIRYAKKCWKRRMIRIGKWYYANYRHRAY